MADARILVVEDDPQFGLIVKNLLEAEGLSIDIARSRNEAFDRMGAHKFDAILMDLVLGEESGLSILRELNEEESSIPVIVMTAHGSIETVAEALRLNAFDYITKPFTGSAITDILRRAVEKTRQSVTEFREKSGEVSFPAIIGQSPAMIEVFKAIARVSGTDATVLISGESGTGKELVARAIHDSSVRRRNPFIAVNCGAFTDTLLESELFGHMKGAFTGADRTHRGIFESATGGTVFLDEISETSPAFQVKLLRVLQERKIRPAGSSEERQVDARVIAATNRPIQSLLTSPNFRRDLLYRLSVININVPPLRERKEDVPHLTKSFLRKFNRRQNKKVTLPPSTLEWIQNQAWPGNVRELENAIERAVTMSLTGTILPQEMKQYGLPPKDRSSASIPIPPALLVPEPQRKPAQPAPVPVVEDGEPPSLDNMTRDHIVRVVKYTNGNKLRAAEILGVGRWSLYRMSQRLGIDLDSMTFDAPPRRRRGAGKKAAAPQDDLFDNVNDIVYTRDMEGLITSINLAGEHFFGTPRARLLGSSLHGLFADEELEDNLKATNEKLLHDGADRSVMEVKNGAGQFRILESNVSLMRDASGKPAGARGIMRDVTESKELEALLRQQKLEVEEANEKLKELNRIKADFTAMLVHDLKTPTASMIMALDFVQSRLSAEQGSDLDRMIKAGLAAGRTMIQIVEDMLELFRVDSTEIDLLRSLHTVDDMVRDPYEEVLILAQQKGIELESRIPTGLPLVEVDRMKMSRVFANLLGNAVKFTSPGGQIRMEARRSEGASIERGSTFVQVSISDTGEGIAPEHLSYIFDPYWQSSHKGAGTGLGLAIVKRIVSAHGGSVSVRSKPGIGSEFTVTLPVNAANG